MCACFLPLFNVSFYFKCEIFQREQKKDSQKPWSGISNTLSPLRQQKSSMHREGKYESNKYTPTPPTAIAQAAPCTPQGCVRKDEHMVNTHPLERSLGENIHIEYPSPSPAGQAVKRAGKRNQREYIKENPPSRKYTPCWLVGALLPTAEAGSHASTAASWRELPLLLHVGTSVRRRRGGNAWVCCARRETKQLIPRGGRPTVRC